jgi:hypothetical protein
MSAESQLDTPAKRLAFARVRAGYGSALEFSRRHGVPQPTYALHENGRRGIRPVVAKRYAEALKNCTPEWILYGKGEIPKFTTGMEMLDNVPGVLEEAEESAAFMLLYDRISALAKEREDAMEKEFGVRPRLFGIRADERGTVLLTFRYWRQIIDQETDLSITERVIQVVEAFEDAGRQMAEAMRKISNAVKNTR